MPSSMLRGVTLADVVLGIDSLNCVLAEVPKTLGNAVVGSVDPLVDGYDGNCDSMGKKADVAVPVEDDDEDEEGALNEVNAKGEVNGGVVVDEEEEEEEVVDGEVDGEDDDVGLGRLDMATRRGRGGGAPFGGSVHEKRRVGRVVFVPAQGWFLDAQTG